MNKNQLIQILKERNGYPLTINERIVDDFLEVVTDSLVQGEEVQIAGFGTFDIRVSNPRLGTNPRTLEKFDIGHYARPSFRAGRSLKHSIKNSNLAVSRAESVKESKVQELKVKKVKIVG